MPYRIEKVKGGYRVVNAITGDVKAAKTTKARAERQIRLLRGIDHGMRPSGRSS
jgi:hypothetical protein